MADQLYGMICENCGSDRVTRDAWAEWDAKEQQWVLGAVFDYAFCHECDQATHIAETLHEADSPIAHP